MRPAVYRPAADPALLSGEKHQGRPKEVGVAYHLMAQAGMARAPWAITTVVSCLPVLVLGMGLYRLRSVAYSC